MKYFNFIITTSMIDPRPFSYEYRKPRLNNPTLYLFINNIYSQSSNLYESLYHLRLPQKKYVVIFFFLLRDNYPVNSTSKNKTIKIIKAGTLAANGTHIGKYEFSSSKSLPNGLMNQFFLIDLVGIKLSGMSSFFDKIKKNSNNIIKVL